MSQCQSCGMPMEKPEDFGGGKADNLYCRYCSDYQGSLLPRDQVKQNMIQFYTQKMGKSLAEATVIADQTMANMPAWRQTRLPDEQAGPAWRPPTGEAGQTGQTVEPAWQSPAPTAVASEPVAPVQPSAQEPVIEIGSLGGSQPIVEPLKEPEPEPESEPAPQPLVPDNKPPEPTS